MPASTQNLRREMNLPRIASSASMNVDELVQVESHIGQVAERAQCACRPAGLLLQKSQVAGHLRFAGLSAEGDAIQSSNLRLRIVAGFAQQAAGKVIGLDQEETICQHS